MLRAVLFDWGETLFYSTGGAEVLIQAGLSEQRARQLWQEVWTATKTPEALARRRDLSASAHRAAWEILLAPVEAEIPGVAEALYESVRDPSSWLPYPDVPSVMHSLRRAQVRVGVVSNIAFPLRPAFERHGLADQVDVFAESVRFGVEKPDPSLFLTACRELGAAPADTLMVGDSHLTDGGAVEAGLVTLLLPAVSPGTPRGLSVVLRLVGPTDTPGGTKQRLR